MNSVSEAKSITVNPFKFGVPTHKMLPNFPDEVCIKILSFLSIKDQITVSLTCHYARLIAHRALCERAKKYGFQYGNYAFDHDDPIRHLKNLFAAVIAIQNIEYKMNEGDVVKSKHILNESEKVYDYVDKKGWFGFLGKEKVLNVERTLLKIARISFKRLGEFISVLLKVEGTDCLIPYIGAQRSQVGLTGKVDSASRYSFSSFFRRDVEQGRINAIHFWREEGADINDKGAGGKAALHLAIANPSVVALLLEMKANPDIKDIGGNTPLHDAALNNNVETIELLLEETDSETDSSSVDKENESENSRVDVENNNGRTPLFIAVSYGSYDAAKALLEYDANPNIPDHKGYTPLISRALNHDFISLLLAYKADPNCQDPSNGYTALHYAAEKGQAKSVLTLIDAGADMTIKNHKGKTPLDLSVNIKPRDKRSFVPNIFDN